ncbi:MAG: DNA internalization-related competence protein ComEC/Rec2 [Clostridia bacterium]|nr:DNA internalization-related competence protein ComEC/Rec2 [Clostridia bacterium]
MERLINIVYDFYKKERKFCITILLLILCIRIGYTIYLYELKYTTDDTNRKMYVTIIEKQKETEEKISYLVEFEKHKFVMNIYTNKDEIVKYYSPCDILKIRGKVIIPITLNNPYEFCYKRYLNSQNIIGTISAYSAEKLGVKRGMDFNFFKVFREKLLEKTEEMLNPEEKSLFDSIICGVRDYSDNEVQNDFRESGSSHFLSISGTHILYFLYVIDMLIQHCDKKIKKYIKILFILLFNFMVGFQISLVRATIMYMINHIEIEKIRMNQFLKLFISAMVIIIYHPYSIFNSSFIFSFLSIIGIEILEPFINSYFNILLLKLFGLKYMNEEFYHFSKFKKALYFSTRYMISSISFALSVQIMTIPFQMYFFCEINMVSILSNLFLSPIMAFVLIVGFLSFFLVNIPFISDILLLANIPVLSFIITMIKILSKMEFLRFSTIKPDFLSMIFYYVIFTVCFFSKYLYKCLHMRKKKKILRGVTIFLILYIISIYIKVLFFEEYVYFFNVGQGNMALLHKSTTNIVVDLGSTSKGVASNVLLSFLKAKGISKIDMVIITHLHDDHMNGVEEVIENVEVSKILFSNFENKGETKNDEFENMVKEGKSAVVHISKDDNILLKDFKIEVLSPPNDKIIKSNDILNSNSAVLLISKGEYHYLFLGDATIETEKYMFQEKMYKEEVYHKLRTLSAIQIGHHGSKTSTSNWLLENVNPCIAIISSSKKKFGHPSQETIEVLNQYRFEIKITEYDGAIKIK